MLGTRITYFALLLLLFLSKDFRCRGICAASRVFPVPYYQKGEDKQGEGQTFSANFTATAVTGPMTEEEMELLQAYRNRRQKEEMPTFVTRDSSKVEEEDLVRQMAIEKFKNSILQRLHLSRPTILEDSEAGMNGTDEVMEALPLFLKRRILDEVENTNGILEPPVERTEEKETIVLIKPLRFKWPGFSSAVFAVEVADTIYANGVKSARLQFETSEPSVKGKRMEVWELRPKLEAYNPLLVQPFVEESRLARAAARMQVSANSSDLNSIPDAYYEELGSSQQEIETEDTVRTRYGDAAQEFDKRGNLLAATEVPSVAGRVGVTLYITGRFREWVAYRNRHPMLHKLIRTILVICPECDPESDPIDTRKKLKGSGVVDNNTNQEILPARALLSLSLLNALKGILEVIHDVNLRRRRRSTEESRKENWPTITNKCIAKGHKFKCCTQYFQLNFKDLGWHKWIVHPKFVEPNYCRGSCQVSEHTNTPHSQMMHIYRQQNYPRLSDVQREAMLSCCHPTKMASMTLLYLDKDKQIQMNTLHNIIVRECRCS
ncbi:unnamed protein product [Schistocephalus solidus]|uniref:TGF_BETA_2 domain-containing protein n=1 Tax=Schistocephalus solidus TaxID=70667 RepID=A0A183SSN8_SCHSO|nr:unnamed protein product [Schistocephalus solidus]